MPGTLCEVVTQVNRLLCQDVEDSGNFMTLFSLEINPSDHKISWVRAGHDPALLFDPDTNGFTELKGRGVALGLDESMVYELNHLSGMKMGQIIVLYTDGIWEAQDDQGRQFGKDRLKQLIVDHQTKPAKKILNEVMAASSRFQDKGVPQDDVTLIIVKF